MGPCFAAISPDGNLLATACGKEQVQLWDARTGRQIGALDLPHCSWVTFTPDGTALAAAGPADKVSLWNLATGKQVAAIPRAEFATFPSDHRLRVKPVACYDAAAGHVGFAAFSAKTGRRRHQW